MKLNWKARIVGWELYGTKIMLFFLHAISTLAISLPGKELQQQHISKLHLIANIREKNVSQCVLTL